MDWGEEPHCRRGESKDDDPSSEPGHGVNGRSHALCLESFRPSGDGVAELAHGGSRARDVLPTSALRARRARLAVFGSGSGLLKMEREAKHRLV